MKLIAITPTYFYPGEAQAIADALTAGGFWRVHIRKPGSSVEEIMRLVEEIPAEFRQRLTLHDHQELAARLSVGGVQLNGRCMAVPEGFTGMVSRGAHSPAEAVNAAKSADYVLLSPMAPSLSKPGYQPAYSFDELAAVASEKIFALGGVTRELLPRIEAAGFGGAALLTDAWRRPIAPEHFALQFITHPTETLDVAEGARLALEGGCRWIQLRHKDADTETLLDEGSRIAALCREFGATFIIDDHVELVDRLDADGVHLGQNDMPVADARRILGPRKIIGATANTFETLLEVARSGADYAGVGPFRFTSTKKNLAPTLGLGGYDNIMGECRRNGVRIPVVAIGGIVPADIPAILRTGVRGVAISSTILGSPDPAATTREIINLINNNLHNPEQWKNL